MTRRIQPAADVIIVAAVSTGANYREAGELAGVSAKTVQRRLAVPDVRAALNEERNRLATLVADRLAGRAEAAVDRLCKVIAEGTDRDAVSAARVMLDALLRHRDALYVSDRLADLEAATAATPTATTHPGRLA